MGTLPTDCTVKIVTQNGTALTSENCGIWSFGFNGRINFENGQIVAYTETPLTNDTDSVIVMVITEGHISVTLIWPLAAAEYPDVPKYGRFCFFSSAKVLPAQPFLL